ncbi:DUF3307 domain-containing protein [Salmonella enterica subsp. enterica serovar Newport]|nr:DUF3307 domain-containing protein [Salmonella enterica subsp. enterica serovar Newport]
MYLLLALLFVKHFACDYPLQSQWMLQKAAKKGWAFPLTAHAALHGWFTFFIVNMMMLAGDPGFALLMGLADFCAHWAIDYWKAQRTSAEFGSRRFWNLLGFDQLLHNLTYLAIIFCYSLYMAGI